MPKRSVRIIIDTNLLVSFLLTKDYSKLDKLIATNGVVILFSRESLEEFTEVVKRPKLKKYFSIDDLEDLLMLLRTKAILVTVTSEVDACRDPKDNFLLALAKDGNAKYLLTGDKDLLILKRFGRTKIVTIKDYLLIQ